MFAYKKIHEKQISQIESKYLHIPKVLFDQVNLNTRGRSGELWKSNSQKIWFTKMFWLNIIYVRRYKLIEIKQHGNDEEKSQRNK